MTRTADELRERAKQLRTEADWLIADAERIEQRAAKAAEYDRRKRTIYRYAMRAAQGFDVLAPMMAELGLSEGDARALLERAEQSYGRIARARRDREICQMAWTHRNAEIAARFDLHPNHVSRIISRRTRGWLKVK